MASHRHVITRSRFYAPNTFTFPVKLQTDICDDETSVLLYKLHYYSRVWEVAFSDCFTNHLSHVFVFNSIPSLPSQPVLLGALLLLFELKAGNLHEVEKSVAHHIGNAVIHIMKTLLESGEQPKASDMSR